MKRLAFWMIVALVVVNVASRRESRARDGGRSARPEGNSSRLVVYQQQDDDPADHTTIVITRGRSGSHEIVVPQPPAPPKPPLPPRKSLAGRKRPNPVKASLISDANKPTPSWFPTTHEQELLSSESDSKGYRVLTGPLSASPTEAMERLRSVVRSKVFQWLTPEIESIKEPSNVELESLVISSHIQPVLFDLDRMGVGTGMTLGAAGVVSPSTENLYTIYKAGQVVDFSEDAKHRVIKQYQTRLVRERLFQGGGVLLFTLICLGTLGGYIRADEATKGYYTRRLRMVATVGVGVASFALYRWLA